jgi:hypothetical protein
MSVDVATIRNGEPRRLQAAMNRGGGEAPFPSPPRAASPQMGRILAFLLGLGTRQQINVIGYLPFAELALLLLLPLNFTRAFSSANLRKTGWMVPLCFVWLASAIFTDIYRETDWSLAARGIARAFVYCIAIPQIVWFFSTDGYKKAVWFTVGTIPSIILSQFVFRGGVIEGRERVYGRAIIDFESHWSMVLGAGIFFGLLVVYRRSPLLAHAVAWAAGVFQITNGSRSAGGVFLIGSVLCALKRSVGGKLWSRDTLLSAVRVALAGLVLAGVSYAIYSLYADAAATGRLGEKARDKFLTQSSSRLGLLLGGREAVVSGVIAALDSPFIGYGSWPLDREGFYLRACELSGRDPDPTFYKVGYPLIPTHSHVMCAWVENGIGGLFFWTYVIVFYVRQILRPVVDEKRLGLYLAAAVLSLVWHVLFSPMAGRIEQSVVIALVANDAYGLTHDAAQRRLQAWRRAT